MITSGLKKIWLSRRFITMAGGLLLAAQVVVLGFLIAGSYGLVKKYGPDTVSFVGFYAAGELATEGHPEQAYEQKPQYEAEEKLTHRGVLYLPFLYPPVYMLVCAPLKLLPLAPSFVLFDVVTAIFYLIVLRRILGETGYGWILPALAFPPTLWTIGYGQNSFLTAALLGTALLLVDRRPALAGGVFGLLCYKPQFALLVPVALAAGKRWSTIIWATLTVIILVGLSIGLFGWQAWREYFHSFFGSSATYDFEIENANIFGIISPFAGARLLGLSARRAEVVQFAATLSAIVLVGWVWAMKAPLAWRAAVLTAATLIAVPYASLYDLTIAAIAAAWLIRGVRGTEIWLPTKEALVIVYLLPLVAFQLAIITHWPVATFPSAILVSVCAFIVWREHKNWTTPPCDA
jgi:hypothetical protein